MEKQFFTKDVQAILDKQYEKLTDEQKAHIDAGLENLTDEQIATVDKAFKQELALSEVFSQCWDDEDFEAEFKADPKKIFDKFGVEYDDNVDYVVINNDPKTITYVLPFEGVKESVEGLSEVFKKKVENIVEGKQVIPENWCFKFIQNTEDINYIVIPMSPENLTPEELEFVNGCGLFSFLGLDKIFGIFEKVFEEVVVVAQHYVLVADVMAAAGVAAIYLGIALIVVVSVA